MCIHTIIVLNNRNLTMASRTSPTEPANCLCFNLRRTARAITQTYDAALAPLGLKATQFTVLQITAAAGGAPMSRLARQLGMDRTTLTRNLQPLEKKGLILLAAGKDRRERMVSLAEEGKELLTRATPAWESAQSRLYSALGPVAFSSLLDRLDSVVDKAIA